MLELPQMDQHTIIGSSNAVCLHPSPKLPGLSFCRLSLAALALLPARGWSSVHPNSTALLSVGNPSVAVPATLSSRSESDDISVLECRQFKSSSSVSRLH